MPDLLIEIGVEEIPADVILPALDQMKVALADGLTALRLTHEGVEVYGTPRRLAAIVKNVAGRQPDEVREIKGPPASAAFDADGNPTKAAQGFAAKNGLEVSALRVVEDDKGSFVYATVQEAGQPAAEVIPALLDEMMTGFVFPKTLKWGDLEERFARPVRWLIALLGNEVLNWAFAGVQAGRDTRGHRFLGDCSVAIPSPEAYLDILRDQHVLADHRERRDIIAQRAEEAAATVNGRPRLDPDLLDENNFLVEWPSCILGSYPDRFMALPEAVPVTVMQKHQRYFPVEDAAGKLMPYFIIIRNGEGRGEEIIRKGNEKVIVPRLEDAEFYMTEDLKTPLPERLESLKRVTYMESLGTLYDKTIRIERLVEWLCEHLDVADCDRLAALRAAELSKCDQVTLMVGDGKLAALQGLIGGHYARLAGEPESVVEALSQQYLPIRPDDPAPSSDAGKMLALADKLDNLAAAFRLGMIPKGTRDPQGLRRQTQALVTIMQEGDYYLDVRDVVWHALSLLPDPDPRPKGALSTEEAGEALLDFIHGRLAAAMEDEGVAYDVVRAVLAADWYAPVEIIGRGRALQGIRAVATDFEAQVDTATRPANISRAAVIDEAICVDPELFADPTETALWDACLQADAEIEVAPDYPAIWEALRKLHDPIEALFEAVMVNAEDEALRNNRLALMRTLDRLYLKLADFTQIVQ